MPPSDKRSSQRRSAAGLAVSRRSILGGLGALALPSHALTAHAELGPSLGELALKTGVRFGAAISEAALAEPALERFHVHHCRILTTDPGFIMPFVRPEAARTTYETTDRLVALAARHGLPIRGHCLIWNDNVPDFVRRLSARELERLLDSHIEETVGRYRGHIHSWDVINEPFHPLQRQAGLWREGPWTARLGPGHIARALRRASTADPSAKVIINEAWVESHAAPGLAVRRRLLELVDDVKSQGVPLHAVGLQCHLQAHTPFDGPSFAGFLADLAKRGVDIYITELDVNDLELDGVAEHRDRLVASHYRALVETALSSPAVKVIQTWGLTDRFSWLRNPFFVRQFPERRRRFEARPLPFDAALRPKAAADAIAAALRARSPTP